jgi:glutamine amidotransferase
MAYRGSPVVMEELLLNTKHSLVDQSMASRSAETPTNGDGFGVGWYGNRETPGLFRSIRPAWNDFNFRDLVAQVESPLFFAHVRATSLATVQETNCHPFRYRKWLFVHNGEVLEIERFRRDLLIAVAPHLFSNILGSTDSELMFHLALTFGLEKDPLGAVEKMAGFIEKVGREHDVPEPLWMTLGFSDGETLYAVRYASDNDAPSLYHSRDMEDLFRLNPALRDRFPGNARAIVSEPTSDVVAWVEVPQATAVILHDDEVVMRPFRPRV